MSTFPQRVVGHTSAIRPARKPYPRLIVTTVVAVLIANAGPASAACPTCVSTAPKTCTISTSTFTGTCDLSSSTTGQTVTISGQVKGSSSPQLTIAADAITVDAPVTLPGGTLTLTALAGNVQIKNKVSVDTATASGGKIFVTATGAFTLEASGALTANCTSATSCTSGAGDMTITAGNATIWGALEAKGSALKTSGTSAVTAGSIKLLDITDAAIVQSTATVDVSGGGTRWNGGSIEVLAGSIETHNELNADGGPGATAGKILLTATSGPITVKGTSTVHPHANAVHWTSSTAGYPGVGGTIVLQAQKGDVSIEAGLEATGKGDKSAKGSAQNGTGGSITVLTGVGASNKISVGNNTKLEAAARGNNAGAAKDGEIYLGRFDATLKQPACAVELGSNVSLDAFNNFQTAHGGKIHVAYRDSFTAGGGTTVHTSNDGTVEYRCRCVDAEPNGFCDSSPACAGDPPGIGQPPPAIDPQWMGPCQGCGTAVVESGEQCDDGNAIDGDGTCQHNCKKPTNDDGIKDPTEECDDGSLGKSGPTDCCVTNKMPTKLGDCEKGNLCMVNDHCEMKAGSPTCVEGTKTRDCAKEEGECFTCDTALGCVPDAAKLGKSCGGGDACRSAGTCGKNGACGGRKCLLGKKCGASKCTLSYVGPVKYAVKKGPWPPITIFEPICSCGPLFRLPKGK